MLQSFFIALTLVVNLFLVLIGFKALGAGANRLKYLLIFGSVLWQIYIYLMARSGLLLSYDFPPRFALAYIVPSFLFIGIFLFRHRNKEWIHRIPEQWIIYFQSFRIIVETLFIYALADGIFNYHVTLKGYNYDMIFALTAIPVALAAYKKGWLSRRVLIYWNYLGLAVLASVIFLFMTSMYNPSLFGSETPLLPLESMAYPYVLIAGFLMPSAVFLHILSIVQLNRETKPIR